MQIQFRFRIVLLNKPFRLSGSPALKLTNNDKLILLNGGSLHMDACLNVCSFPIFLNHRQLSFPNCRAPLAKTVLSQLLWSVTSQQWHHLPLRFKEARRETKRADAVTLWTTPKWQQGLRNRVLCTPSSLMYTQKEMRAHVICCSCLFLFTVPFESKTDYSPSSTLS